jgi:chromosome segregation ATPase
MYEGDGEPIEDLTNVAGNTVTTKSGESDINTSPRHLDKVLSKYDPSVAPTETDEEFKTLRQINHDQYNQIQTLKRDMEYWQTRWLNLTIDNQLAELDLKNFVQGKNSFSTENKQLKQTVENHTKTLEENKASFSELKNKYDSALIEIVRLKKQSDEIEKSNPKYNSVEEEILAKANSIQDLNSIWRLVYSLQAGAQQRMYAQAMNSTQADGSTGVSNGHAITPNTTTNTGGNPLLAQNNAYQKMNGSTQK